MFKLRNFTTVALRCGLNRTKNVTASTIIRCKSDLYEPDYLISMEPDEPTHDCLNLQIKGYDYTLVENYQRTIHKYAKSMGFDIEDSWATPAQSFKVQKFKPASTVVDDESTLNVYERNVQVCDIPACRLGTLIRVANATLPEGCTLRIHEHLPEYEEIRYVPDNKLLDLKEQLDVMGGPRVENKRKKR